jgi:hypothetical protein
MRILKWVAWQLILLPTNLLHITAALFLCLLAVGFAIVRVLVGRPRRLHPAAFGYLRLAIRQGWDLHRAPVDW